MKRDALAGIRVIDFTTTIAGPHCTRLLADLGAEVVKIESPEGDMMRTRPPIRNGASHMFGYLNAGKHSLVLDLKRPSAIAAVKRMAARADIVVENFRPGVMKRLGLDYPSLRRLKPDLIYCAISGYGQTGPSAELPAYAPMIHAASGYEMAHLAYQPGRERPDNCGVFFADFNSGAYAFGAIMTALYQRQASGIGQMIDVSMCETMLGTLMGEVMRAQVPYDLPSRPMFGPVRTRDGYVMPAVASEKTFQGLCRAAGHPEWIEDPRFARYADRRNHWGAYVDELEQWSGQLSSEQVMAQFEAHGVPASRYRTVAELMSDPQLAHREALQPVTDAGGTVKVMAPPFRMSEAETRVRPFCQSLGEQSEGVLRGFGFSEAEIADLRTKGAAG
ncbi:CaiB/BaiF CoA transferase family protein [Desertibaculum subflavum]|uniref:CaiB/BaiF CoA transferase family protein n=1 Tax=Desertibaculum subflavum TaxID=2268458 RepID=UPI000E66573F